MAHPVAHEGNPRTASITIDSGEVLSTTTIEVEIPGPAPGGPILPPTEEPTGSSSNPFKYEFVDFRYGIDGQNTGEGAIGAFEPNSATAAIPSSGYQTPSGIILEYSRKDSVFMSGCVVSPPVRWSSQWLDAEAPGSGKERVRKHENLDFLETWNLVHVITEVAPGGYRYGEFPANISPHSINQYAIAFVKVNAIGSPFSGVAVGVKPGSTYDNFTGIVAAFNWANQTEYIFRYDNQPLASTVTTLASRAWGVDYVVNDGIKVWIAKAHTFYTDPPTWSIHWNSTSLTGLTDGDIPYLGSDMRVALVNLESTVDSGGDDAIVWTEVSGLVWAD